MATHEVIEKVKQRSDIVSVVSQYLTLKKAGKYYKAPCPFHSEKTPSFVVSPERQRWHCFGGCHDGGDVISFVMKIENLSFAESLKSLGIAAGLRESELDSKSTTSSPDDVSKDVVMQINSLAAKFYGYVLTQKPQISSPALEYLKSRGISDKIAEKFQMGYAPQQPKVLYNFLTKKGFSEKQIVATGLCGVSQYGAYDRFKHRLMFAICDSRGQVVGFSGRTLPGAPTTEAKYINTPETITYHKRESLYGLHITRDAIKKSGVAVVVEGEFDLITPYIHGLDNFVAIKGSAFTIEQLQILKRYCHRITLALDSDLAGIDAIKRSIKVAAEAEMEVSVCEVPGGKDPDEASRLHLLDFKHALKHTTPAYDFILNIFKRDLDPNDPFSKNTYAQNVIDFLSDIKNPIIRSHYSNIVGSTIGVTQKTIDSMIDAHIKKSSKKLRYQSQRETDTKQQSSRIETLQKHILASILETKSSEFLDIASKYLSPSDFTILAASQVYEFLTQRDPAHPDPYHNLINIDKLLPQKLESFISEISLLGGLLQLSATNDDFLTQVKDYLRSHLKTQIGAAIESDTDGNSSQYAALSKRLRDLG